MAIQVKYSRNFLNKLEDLFAESDYHLRYEKGSFKAGFCVLKDTKIAIVNKYFPLEGKINAVLEILRSIEIDRSNMNPKNLSFYSEIISEQLEL